MILGNDLLLLPVEQHEIFHIIEQFGRGTETGDRPFQARARLPNLHSIDLFLLILYPQPVEEVVPTGGEAAHLRFQRIGQNADCVGVEELGNVSLVVGEVIVKGVLEADVGILQLDKHQRQSVDVEQDVGTAKGRSPIGLNPELGDGEEFVATIRTGVIKVNHPHATRNSAPSIVFILHLDAIADQTVEFGVSREGGHGRARLGQYLHGTVDGSVRQIGVKANGRSPDAIAQNHLPLIAAVGAIVQVCRIYRETVQPLETMRLLECLQGRLFDLVFGNEVGHGQGCRWRQTSSVYGLSFPKDIRSSCECLRSLIIIISLRDWQPVARRIHLTYAAALPWG